MSDRRLPDDRELDEFLAGRSDVSRRYREARPQETAPPELDQPVLDRARRALELEQRARRRRVVVPLSLAASVVVTFSVVVLMRQQSGGLPPPVTVTSEQKSAVMKEQAAPQPVPELAPAKPAAPAMAPSPPQEREEYDALRQKKEEAADTGALAEPAPRRDAAGVAPAGAAATMQIAPSSARMRSADDAKAKVSPQGWLSRIRKMKIDGDVDDARREIDAFQRAYPDYDIPDDLKVLIRSQTPPTP